MTKQKANKALMANESFGVGGSTHVISAGRNKASISIKFGFVDLSS